MRNGTLPIPERPEPPIYLDPHLWFAVLFIFGTLLGMATLGFFMIDNGHVNDCEHLQASPNQWTQLCFKVNNTIYTLFGVLGSIVTVSTIMYLISSHRSSLT